MGTCFSKELELKTCRRFHRNAINAYIDSIDTALNRSFSKTKAELHDEKTRLLASNLLDDVQI